jgi:hypothetical protein
VGGPTVESVTVGIGHPTAVGVVVTGGLPPGVCWAVVGLRRRLWKQMY